MNNSLTGNSYSRYAYQTRFCTAQLLRGCAVITTLQVQQDTWWPGHSHTFGFCTAQLLRGCAIIRTLQVRQDTWWPGHSLTNHNWKGNTAAPQAQDESFQDQKKLITLG